MATLKELSTRAGKFSGGHRLCPGCGAGIIVRQVLAAAKNPVVVACATGCLEVSSTIYPYTAWNTSFIHNAFENAAATISGVEAAYRSLKRRKKFGLEDQEFDFIAFGGDGGTYDIGFQSLSGAMERGHKILYICYDNGAYMNTGIQRSSATPMGANTTTSPAGKKIPGKTQFKKELTDVMAAHYIPYVAQAAPSNWKDLTRKVEKALSIDGPSFINVLSVCPRGWRTPEEKGLEITRTAIDTCFWPLFEVENGTDYTINYKPKNKRPIEEWLKPQGRFKHLFKPENKHLIEKIQKHIDNRWEMLLRRAGEID
ncbi:pyruvate ferredoxin oxidoreductase [Anoxybacter fermentans]|uniref:Pyruvate ferredoxin oxidoreductase n=1 Tax=Anoxybacter fermentans TaxID=1323375 RepID=A0A3S9T1M1_9FIRM|nr:thiamine pyrophosphate-dependent enzyme [Anoxybacter fermentans]AZR74407.1 pyruvate ferredoxin oxidoreductase [Anoxybacter fermentans]